jgi:Arc/MetJ-type ribon-helix-helix transcriptional regulator
MPSDNLPGYRERGMIINHTTPRRRQMQTAKIAITIDQGTLVRLDRLVTQQVFPSRSNAIQVAIQEKIERLDRTRLARECAKLDPREEQALAEEGMTQELAEWPAY